MTGGDNTATVPDTKCTLIRKRLTRAEQEANSFPNNGK
jgi:hypothetical protein